MGPSGKSGAVLNSAFQKAIRRGNEELAIWSIRDIAAVGFNRALLRALYVAQEDVGNCELLEMLATIKDGDMDLLERCVLAMCRIPKTRAPCWFQRVVAASLPNYQGNLPQMSYGGDVSKPSKQDYLTLPIVEAGIMCRVGLEDVRTRQDAIRALRPSMLAAFKKRPDPMMVYCALLAARNEVPQVQVVMPASEARPGEYKAIPLIPDYVYDKHTAEGKSMKRGYQHFLDEACILTKRLFVDVDPFEERARLSYVDSTLRTSEYYDIWLLSHACGTYRKAIDSRLGERKAHRAKTSVHTIAKRPKKVFPRSFSQEKFTDAASCAKDAPSLPGEYAAEFTGTPILRVQLRTAACKAPVYFAKRRVDDKTVVIKGPVSQKEANEMVSMDVAKRQLGVPTLLLTTRKFNEELYLETESVIPVDFGRREVVNSKLERGVVRYTGDLSQWSIDKLDTSSEDVVAGVMVALAMRHVTGTVDTCPRNLVVGADGRVYSVDDPLRPSKLVPCGPAQLWSKKQHSAAYSKALERVWPQVEAELFVWHMVLEEKECKNGELARVEHLLASPYNWAF